MKPSYFLVKLNSTTTQIVMPGRAKRPADQSAKLRNVCTQKKTTIVK